MDKPEDLKMRGFSALAFLLIFIGAAIPRLIGLGRSLWAAEAWLANSILADSLHQMFYYDSWLQTTPPLFLLLARGAVKVFGASDITLRSLPFAFGMAAVVVTAVLALRLFRFPFAILCTTLIALAPTAIRYSLELKQYTGDLAVSAVILLALWNYIEARRGAYLTLVALFFIGLFLSHTSVMFVPLAACVLLFTQHLQPLRARIRRVAGFLLLVSVLAGLHYYVFARPNMAPNLDSYWQDGFPQVLDLKNAATFYTKYIAGAAIYFFLPDQSKDVLKSLLDSAPNILRVIFFLGVLGAIAAFAIAVRRDVRRLWILSFCLAPAVTLIPVNMLRLYPVNSRRLMLFLLPCIVLGIVLVLDTLWNQCTRSWHTSGQKAFSYSVGVICVVLLLVIGTRPIVWHLLRTEDAEGAVRYMKSATNQEDTIYVHASAAESVKLYVRLLDWRNPSIIYGTAGGPCCTRDQEMQSASAAEASIQHDIQQAATKLGHGSLWIVYGSYVAPEEVMLRHEIIRACGCSGQQQGTFTGILLYKLSCTGTAFH